MLSASILADALRKLSHDRRFSLRVGDGPDREANLKVLRDLLKSIRNLSSEFDQYRQHHEPIARLDELNLLVPLLKASPEPRVRSALSRLFVSTRHPIARDSLVALLRTERNPRVFVSAVSVLQLIPIEATAVSIGGRSIDVRKLVFERLQQFMSHPRIKPEIKSRIWNQVGHVEIARFHPDFRRV